MLVLCSKFNSVKKFFNLIFEILNKIYMKNYVISIKIYFIKLIFYP